jgi:iron complex transport system ATP-binding protein
MITLDAVSLARGPRVLIDKLSAELPRGKITAILGPNGAGKSTLLMAIAGLISPTRGTIRLNAANLSEVSQAERAQRIGYLAQDRSISWPLRVRDLVTLGRLPHGDTDAKSIEAALSAMDVAQFSDRPVDQLSGGEQARVLMARVLAGQHEVILADEPGAALDPKHQIALFNALRAEAKRGATVIIALHDLTAAARHADRALLLFNDASALAGDVVDVLTATSLTRAYGIPHRIAIVDGHRVVFAVQDLLPDHETRAQ